MSKIVVAYLIELMQFYPSHGINYYDIVVCGFVVLYIIKILLYVVFVVLFISS